MKSPVILRTSALLIAGLLACHIAFGQAGNPGGGTPAVEPQEGGLRINPLKALQQLEPPADEAYELGGGDTISLYIAGHPELTHTYQIGPDGLITVDVAGSIKVAGLKREAAAKAVHDKLSAFYTDPSVTIGVDKYGSNTIMIFGNVQHPGILEYDGKTPTLLDAIGRGGLLVNAAAKDGLPDRCIIYRGTDTVVPVALREMLMSNRPLADIRLRRGDMIFVPVEMQQFVSVIGQVTKPGPVAITANLDLKLALAQAGGPTDEAGGNPLIHVVQPGKSREITISFKELMTPRGGSEISLQPGDMIFIPKSGFGKFSYVVTKLSPAATMVTLSSLLF